MSKTSTLLTELTTADLYRQRACVLELGKLGDAAALPALIELLRDEDAKLRKNAAIALGGIGSTEAIEPLMAAAEAEEMNWARPSMLLALGLIGGERASAFLDGFEPRTAEDAAALEKGLGRDREREVATWGDVSTLGDELYANVPPGLAEVALEECAELGLGAEAACESLLRIRVAADDARLGRLRCIHQWLIPLAEAERPNPALLKEWGRGELESLLGRLMDEAVALKQWRDWLNTEAKRLRFRLFLDLGKAHREQLRRAAGVARKRLAPFEIIDNPSAYQVELGLVARGDQVLLAMKPSFLGDERFGYRQRDVGGSINPVMGACLARLLGGADGGVVIDPTCGSATLLIERGMLDAKARLRGIEVSPTGRAAAEANLAASGFSDRSAICAGSAAEAHCWQPFERLLANLPFGMRVKGEAQGIPALYRAIIGHIGKNLRPGGRALLYSANAGALDGAIKKAWRGRPPRRLKSRSGGLDVVIRILEK